MACERGSFSTFLSVQISGGECLLNAVGDTVAFVLRNGQIKETWPYKRPDEFLKPPVLMSTRFGLNRELNHNIEAGECSTKLKIDGATHILLLTDALAH